MKTLKLITVLLFASMIISSCSSDEESIILQEQAAKSLLENYEIGRNTDGSYYVDYELNGASSDNIKDQTGTVNNIHLLNNQSNKNSVNTENLGFVGNEGQLKVNFKDTQNNKVTSVRVEDQDIRLQRDDNELLKDFSFINNGDGTFDLDYNVKNNVVTQVEYNEKLGVYDVILEKGKNDQTNFKHTFTPNEDNFEIHFVTFSKSSKETETRKPRISHGSGS